MPGPLIGCSKILYNIDYSVQLITSPEHEIPTTFSSLAAFVQSLNVATPYPITARE